MIRVSCNMSLEILKRSRHNPAPGDVFCLKPLGRGFLFGRVIATDAVASAWKGVWSGANLIYIYSVESDTATSPTELVLSQLLFPPILTTNEPWKRGLFRHIENRELSARDRLATHCFEYDVKRRIEYYDGFGHRLDARVEPCGKLMLMLVSGIERAVESALEHK